MIVPCIYSLFLQCNKLPKICWVLRHIECLKTFIISLFLWIRSPGVPWLGPQLQGLSQSFKVLLRAMVKPRLEQGRISFLHMVFDRIPFLVRCWTEVLVPHKLLVDGLSQSLYNECLTGERVREMSARKRVLTRWKSTLYILITEVTSHHLLFY